MSEHPLKQPVGQLRELLGQASPRPWVDVPNPHWSQGNHQVRIDDGFSYGCYGELAFASPQNARLIAATVNAMPALLAIAEAAQAVMENVDAISGDSEMIALRDALRLLPNPGAELPGDNKESK